MRGDDVGLALEELGEPRPRSSSSTIPGPWLSIRII
jgi:hypothetical protein